MELATQAAAEEQGAMVSRGRFSGSVATRSSWAGSVGSEAMMGTRPSNQRRWTWRKRRCGISVACCLATRQLGSWFLHCWRAWQPLEPWAPLWPGAVGVNQAGWDPLAVGEPGMVALQSPLGEKPITIQVLGWVDRELSKQVVPVASRLESWPRTHGSLRGVPPVLILHGIWWLCRGVAGGEWLRPRHVSLLRLTKRSPGWNAGGLAYQLRYAPCLHATLLACIPDAFRATCEEKLKTILRVDY